MPWGARIYNGAGSLSIGDDASNFVLRYKQTVATSLIGTSFNGSFTSTTVAAKRPMAFANSSVNCTCVGQRDNGNGTWTISFWVSGPVGTTITIYIFDLAETVASPWSWGVEIFKAAGVKSWFLGAKPMIIRKFGAIGSLPAGRTWAARYSRLGGYGQTFQYNFQNNVFAFRMEMGTIVETQPVWNAGNNPAGQPFGSWSNSGSTYLIAVDVTGY